MTDLAQRLVEEEEQCRLTAYKDTQGLWTIGWGHLLSQDRDWTGYQITQQQADDYLYSDMELAWTLATRYPHFEEMNDVRQAVMVSMSFQMGYKPLHWPKFNSALQVRDYEKASQEGLDSLWHQQTPKRAEREMSMLKSGLWQ